MTRIAAILALVATSAGAPWACVSAAAPGDNKDVVSLVVRYVEAKGRPGVSLKSEEGVELVGEAVTLADKDKGREIKISARDKAAEISVNGQVVRAEEMRLCNTKASWRLEVQGPGEIKMGHAK
jgi:hypothetical protein